ncbi:uncharacterized protein LOC117317708 [Pecten maximus]|uniref:uncharacterized protein LOC117317708 n=1 Tax=Pecten maximus TaxID=6579 RepID=UPI0014591765|nr:uncharacterized protein LOC117317708 [Pecten maximus]
MYCSMNSILCACVLWICVMVSAAGKTKRNMYGDCVRVCHPHNPTWIKKMFRYCVTENECTYCKYYSCPELQQCKKRRLIIPPVPTLDRNCMSCPGTCVYGGKLYKRTDRFKAADDINECQCKNFGRVHCSRKKKPSLRKYCGI